MQPQHVIRINKDYIEKYEFHILQFVLYNLAIHPFDQAHYSIIEFALLLDVTKLTPGCGAAEEFERKFIFRNSFEIASSKELYNIRISENKKHLSYSFMNEKHTITDDLYEKFHRVFMIPYNEDQGLWPKSELQPDSIASEFPNIHTFIFIDKSIARDYDKQFRLRYAMMDSEVEESEIQNWEEVVDLLLNESSYDTMFRINMIYESMISSKIYDFASDQLYLYLQASNKVIDAMRSYLKAHASKLTTQKDYHTQLIFIFEALKNLRMN